MKGLKKLAMIAVATTMCAASFTLLPACSSGSHEHAYEWTQTKAPTCTDPGEFNGVCAEDQATLKHEVPATGHAYGDWVITEAPTSSKAGKAVKTCGNDKTHKLEQELPALTSDKYTYADGKFTFKTDNGDIQFAGVKRMATVPEAVAEAAKNKALVREGSVVKKGGYDEGEASYAYGQDFVYVNDKAEEKEVWYFASQWKDWEGTDKSGVMGLEKSYDGSIFEAKYPSDDKNPKLFLSGYEFNVYSGATDYYYGAESFLKDQYELATSTEKAPNFLGENANLEKGEYSYSYGEGVEGYDDDWNPIVEYMRVKVEFKLSDKNTLAYMKVTAEKFGVDKYTEAEGVFTLKEGATADSTSTVEITQTEGNSDDVLPTNPAASFKMTDFAVKYGNTALGAQKEDLRAESEFSDRLYDDAYAAKLDVVPSNQTALENYDNLYIYLVKDEGDPVLLYNEWGSTEAYADENVWVEYNVEDGYYYLFTKKLGEYKLRFVSQKSNITKDVAVNFIRSLPEGFGVYLPDTDPESLTHWKNAPIDYETGFTGEHPYTLGTYYLEPDNTNPATPFKIKVDANTWSAEGEYYDIYDNSVEITVTKDGKEYEGKITFTQDSNDSSVYTFTPTEEGEYSIEFTSTVNPYSESAVINFTAKIATPYGEVFNGTYFDEAYGATVEFTPDVSPAEGFSYSGQIAVIRAGVVEMFDYTYKPLEGLKVTPQDESIPQTFTITLENVCELKLSFKYFGRTVTVTLEKFKAPEPLLTAEELKETTWEFKDNNNFVDYLITFNSDGSTGTISTSPIAPLTGATLSSTFSYKLNFNDIEFSHIQAVKPDNGVADFSETYANNGKSYFKENKGNIVLNICFGLYDEMISEDYTYDVQLTKKEAVSLTAADLPGEWTASYDLDGDPQIYTLTFNNDNTGSIEYWGVAADFTWKFEEGVLTFTVDETNDGKLQSSLYLSATLLNANKIKGDKIVISESGGNALNFAKNQGTPLTEADVVGSWTTSFAGTSGPTKTYTLTFNNGGAGSISDGETTSTFTWAIAEGKLTFTVDTENGNALTLDQNFGLYESFLNAYDYDGTTLTITDKNDNALGFVKTPETNPEPQA